MKVAERLIEKEGTLQGERVGMTIDTSALAHIMSVLTDLYSDPEAAIIREYSTNAWDSHVEAGVNRPIEVTLPGDLSPFFRIRDYGVGLDADGIRDIYSRYGTSTKRDSDDVVGMLGLGCKSALTYCDQFTLVGVKDGTMTTVAVGRDEDGSGTMTIVDVSPTDEPNGLEVVIPAKRHNALRDKAQAFFQWWAPGTVLVNGKEPGRVVDNDGTTWIVPGRSLVTNQVDRPMVVMGNVAYPVSTDQQVDWAKLPRDTFPVFFVQIGEVNFTPSREALQSTKRTRETLAAYAAEFADAYFATLAAEVAGAPSFTGAVEVWAQRIGHLGLPREKALWNGKPIFTVLSRLRVEDGNPVSEYKYKAADASDSYLVSWQVRGHRQRKTGDRAWRINVLGEGRNTYDHNTGRYLTTTTPTLVFTGYTGKTFTDVKRAKLDEWLTQKNIAGQHRLVFIDKLRPEEKLAWDGCVVTEWAEVEAIKLASSARAGKSLVGSYPGVAPDGNGGVRHRREIPATDIDPDKVLWMHGGMYAASERAYGDGGVPLDYFLISLPENRIAKFKRDFPKAERLGEYQARTAKAAWDKLTADEKLAAAATLVSTPSWLTKNPAPWDDPRLNKLRTFVTHPRRGKAGQVLENYRRFLTALTPEQKEVGELVNSINESYPLLAALRFNAPPDHITLYVNAAYAAERGI